jgi:AcrR family transcriptional regulator
MAKSVNRPYDSPSRDARAAASRAAMLDAARDLFLAHRYAGTTLAMVAEAAGVSLQYVYKVFRNKPGLVKALFDVAIVGDDEPVALPERESFQAIRREPDGRRKLELYGGHMASIGPRVMPILLVVRDAAASDTAAAGLWADLQAERLTGMTAMAGELAAGGQLRKGVTRNEARDVLWAHNSLELWDLLVTQRGWTPAKYGTWLGRQLVAALL